MSIISLFQRKAAQPVSKYPDLDKILKKFTLSPPLDNEAVLKLYATNPTFRAAVSKIAFSVASNEWKVYKQKGKTDTEIENHPFLDKIQNINSYLKGIEGLKTIQALYDLIGECYIIKLRSSIFNAKGQMLREGEKGKVLSYLPVPGTWVQEIDGLIWVTFEDFTIDGKPILKVKPEDCILYKDVDPANPYGRGVGLGLALADEIDAQDKASAYKRKFFYNDATPPFIISADGATEDEVKQLESRWMQKLRGWTKAYTPYFMSNTPTVQQVSTSIKDMDFAQLDERSSQVIRQTYGIPPELFGDISNSNRATIESALTIYYMICVNPRLIAMRDCVIKEMMFDEGYTDVYCDFVDMTPADKDYRLKVMQSFREHFTRNEKRELIDFEPVPDGDGLMADDIEIIETIPLNDEPAPQKTITKSVSKISDNEIDEILKALNIETLRKGTQDTYRGVLIAIVSDTLEEMGVLDKTPYMISVDKFLSTRYEKVLTQINDTTKDKLRREIRDAIINEENLEEITVRVKNVFGDSISGARAEVIALTESHSTVNYGIYGAYVDSKVVDEVEWLHHPEESETPRESHAAMDGKRVNLKAGQMFELDANTSTLYPGGSGYPAHDINCHCTLAAVSVDISDLVQESYRLSRVKQVDLKVQRYAKSFKRAYKSAFSKQEDQVISKIKELWG